MLVGLLRLRQGRTLEAYRWFDRSLLVEIFVGQVFAYIDHSFIATWGFLVCIVLLISVRFMEREERRLERERGETLPVLGGQGLPAAASASARSR